MLKLTPVLEVKCSPGKDGVKTTASKIEIKGRRAKALNHNPEMRQKSQPPVLSAWYSDWGAVTHDLFADVTIEKAQVEGILNKTSQARS